MNLICQYFPLFASISRYFPVNATGLANMLICRHFANLVLFCSMLLLLFQKHHRAPETAHAVPLPIYMYQMAITVKNFYKNYIYIQLGDYNYIQLGLFKKSIKINIRLCLKAETELNLAEPTKITEWSLYIHIIN